MKKQQEQSGKKAKNKNISLDIPENINTKFVGYEKLEIESEIIFILKEKDYSWIITKESPFYVECGGQASDKGWINIDNKVYEIEEFFKSENTNNPAIALKIKNTDIKLKEKIKCVVDYYSRANTTKNHTATHLLQAALIQVLGKQVQQAGSFVNSDFLRFDYTSNHALTKQDAEKIENIVNQKIQENIKLNILYTTLQEARKSGVTALFGEKYNPEQVRVVQVPGFSAELCGGTHVNSTGDIGLFKIESDVALSSGVRRITGLTGPKALESFQNSFNIVKTLVEKFKVKPEQVLAAVEKQSENIDNLNSQIKQLKKQILKTQIPTWQNQVKHVGKIPFLFLELQDFDNSQLKEICESIEVKSPAFYFIINMSSKTPDQISYFGFVSKNFAQEINLKDFAKNILQVKFDLKGGGSPSLIQGGGKKPESNIEQEIIKWLKAI